MVHELKNTEVFSKDYNLTSIMVNIIYLAMLLFAETVENSSYNNIYAFIVFNTRFLTDFVLTFNYLQNEAWDGGLNFYSIS